MIAFDCSECSTRVTCEESALATVECPTCNEFAAPRCKLCDNHFAPVASESLCVDCGVSETNRVAREDAEDAWQAHCDRRMDEQRESALEAS